MKHNSMLTIASLLSILFMTLHLTSDTVHARALGTAEAGELNPPVAVPILVVWLYGTLVLAERRSGYIIMLPVGSLLALGMPVIHEMGAGWCLWRPDRQVQPSPFLFVWTLPRARRDSGFFFHHPLGARTVEPTMGPVSVVQQPEHGKARFGSSLPPAAG